MQRDFPLQFSVDLQRSAMCSRARSLWPRTVYRCTWRSRDVLFRLCIVLADTKGTLRVSPLDDGGPIGNKHSKDTLLTSASQNALCFKASSFKKKTERYWQNTAIYWQNKLNVCGQLYIFFLRGKFLLILLYSSPPPNRHTYTQRGDVRTVETHLGNTANVPFGC